MATVTAVTGGILGSVVNNEKKSHLLWDCYTLKNHKRVLKNVIIVTCVLDNYNYWQIFISENLIFNY